MCVKKMWTNKARTIYKTSNVIQFKWVFSPKQTMTTLMALMLTLYMAHVLNWDSHVHNSFIDAFKSPYMQCKLKGFIKLLTCRSYHCECSFLRGDQTFKASAIQYIIIINFPSWTIKYTHTLESNCKCTYLLTYHIRDIWKIFCGK